MKKLFFAICFNLFLSSLALARVTPVSGYENLPAQQNNTAEPDVRQVEFDDFKEFVQEQFAKAQKADPESINRNVGYTPSLLRRQQEEENKKGFFQKVYEQALDRVSSPADVHREDVVETSSAQPDIIRQNTDWQAPDIPLITAYLPPDNSPFAIPAFEHIPYLMNSIEVLPSGLVKFEETIVVVANGEKLRRGLTKILPLQVYNAQGQAQRLDYSIVSVRVNDMPVEYHLASSGSNALLVPDDDYQLNPGIYTYKFEYVVDNLLWDYGNFYQLYWDIGGNGWNLVVDRLGASLSLPQPGALLEQEILLGSPRGLLPNAVSVRPNGRFATAYIASRPLFIGEGMHLVANIAKEALLPVPLWQKVVRSFYDYGDIYLSLLGLLVITVSFMISWRYIAKDKGQLKLTLNKTAMVIRYLMFDRFDAKSVCGFLLELYKKNIIDIQQAGDTILLIKRTDNLKSLDAFEQKALKQLFPAHETIFNVNRQNMLPFKRFAAKLEQGLKRQMLKFRLKLNLGYLLFSLAMLVMTEAFIAMFKLNPWYVFAVMLTSSACCLAAIALWRCNCRRWLKVLARLFALDVICLGFVILSAVVHPLAALLLITSLAVIVVALDVYSRRLGLIKHYIRDIGNFKDYLLKHHDNIVLGRDFLNYQAAVWALDLEADFVPTNQPEYNKLPIVKNIASFF